jgi:hypothetical protein
MNVDENVFFRQTTLRICGSLNIVTALKRSFDYINLFIPMNRMTLCILDTDLNVLKFVASIGDGIMEDFEQVVPLPEKGRNERATLLKNGEMVRILNQPDEELGTKEIQERLGLNPNISILSMVLRLEGNSIGNLGLLADLCHCNVQRTET